MSRSIGIVLGGDEKLGDVTMPAHFLPKQIGNDFVLGIATGEGDTESIVVYRLDKGR